MLGKLFTPFQYKKLTLKNRIVMAPMTRGFSPNGVPTNDVADYYRRRAEGQVGLIISEGTVVNRPSSSNNPNYPHFYGEKSLAGWKNVIDEVHAADGKMAPQLWHLGVMSPMPNWQPPVPFEGPSGKLNETQGGGVEMDQNAIDNTIQAFVQSAIDAKNLGFDSIELHGAHGYLIDQFFWAGTNLRTDRYGGKTIADRSRFAVELVAAIRKAVGSEFPIIFRVSQWKQQNFESRLANTPAELESWLAPLAAAGVDIFHCSQRRIREPEFADSPLNFAGWVKKVTGAPTIAVGSVGLSGDFLGAFRSEGSTHSPFQEVLQSLDRGEYDLVGVGRALLSDPHWVEKIRDGRESELRGFDKNDLARLT